MNDLTLGEYDVVITSVPARETLEDSQFEQAMAMKEAGVAMPDSVLIDSSRLQNKKQIIKTLQDQTNSPEAQQQRQLAMRGQAAEVAKTEAEATAKGADAQLKGAKTQETIVNTQIAAQGEPDDGSGQAKMHESETKRAVADHQASLKEREFERDTQLKFMDHALKQHTENSKLDLQAQDLAEKRETQRVEQAQAAAAAAQKPTPQGAPA